MNRSRTALATALAMALFVTAVPAQEHGVMFTLLVQFGPGDIVLNKPLVSAMLQEPELQKALQESLGETMVGLRRTTAELPAPHVAGTYQIEVGVSLDTRGAFDEAVRNRVTDVVTAHLQQRLESLLVALPQKMLNERCAQLRDQLQRLQADRTKLATAVADYKARLAAHQSTANELATQLLAARLDVATAERTQEHLERLRAEHSERREARRAELDRIQADKAQHEAGLETLDRRLQQTSTGGNLSREESEALRAEIAKGTAALRASAVARDNANEKFHDQQRLLAVLLEQLPAQALALQRAKARIDALHDETKTILEPAAAMELRQNIADHEARLERLSIDLSVVTTLLTEGEGQRARLQPVRYQLLRHRG
jgi:chromosome segregation ATPase